MNTQLDFRGNQITMTVGQDQTFYYTQGDPLSLLDTLQAVTLAKMTALRDEFERRDGEINKLMVADLVKSQQRLALATATEQLMDDITKEAMSELARIKAMPQPSKGVVAEGKTITKEVATALNKRYEGRDA